MNGETYRARIERKLTQAFSRVALEIRDESHLHAGHAGQNPLGESHFSIHIVSPVFAGMSAVARHREIYRVLADELRERVHEAKGSESNCGPEYHAGSHLVEPVYIVARNFHLFATFAAMLTTRTRRFSAAKGSLGFLSLLLP